MRNWRWIARIVFQVIIPLAIMIAVGWNFADALRAALRRNPNLQFHFRVEWLVPAALLYLTAHTIWAWFWVVLLRHHGINATYATGMRAYFISQFGKYIPGKVWVILIRVVMLGGTPKDKAIIGVTATYETLTSMAAGAVLGAILLPMLNINLNGAGAGGANQQIFAQAQGSILMAIALIPLSVGLLHRLVVHIARKRVGPDVHLPNMNLLVLLRGLIQASVGWLLLGLSVWMVVQAVQPEPAALTADSWIRFTAINCLSYVLGFIVVVAPAGGGVREYVFRELIPAELPNLAPEVAAAFAVMIALIVRLIWTVAEFVLIGMLYWLIPAAQRPHLTGEVKEATG